MKKRDLLNAGYSEAEIENVFHKKGVRRYDEEFTEQEIAEKQEKLCEFRERMSMYLVHIKEMREAEEKRQWYLNDLKVHPEKYVDRNGLRSKGMTMKEISSMKPLFWKGAGYYGKKYYYSAETA